MCSLDHSCFIFVHISCTKSKTGSESLRGNMKPFKHKISRKLNLDDDLKCCNSSKREERHRMSDVLNSHIVLLALNLFYLQAAGMCILTMKWLVDRYSTQRSHTRLIWASAEHTLSKPSSAVWTAGATATTAAVNLWSCQWRLFSSDVLHILHRTLGCRLHVCRILWCYWRCFVGTLRWQQPQQHVPVEILCGISCPVS